LTVISHDHPAREGIQIWGRAGLRRSSTGGFMSNLQRAGAMLALVVMTAGCGDRDARVEEAVAGHMVGEALLAAHFIAAAERAGMEAEAINAILRDIAARSAIDEFWITDSSGRAYLTNMGANFIFSPSKDAQPQASAFWALVDGTEEVVVQTARVREIDDQVFKYVGVAGVDKPRIVQVGVSGDHLGFDP
jgi:hypothetical protein